MIELRFRTAIICIYAVLLFMVAHTAGAQSELDGPVFGETTNEGVVDGSSVSDAASPPSSSDWKATASEGADEAMPGPRDEADPPLNGDSPDDKARRPAPILLNPQSPVDLCVENCGNKKPCFEKMTSDFKACMQLEARTLRLPAASVASIRDCADRLLTTFDTSEPEEKKLDVLRQNFKWCIRDKNVNVEASFFDLIAALHLPCLRKYSKGVMCCGDEATICRERCKNKSPALLFYESVCPVTESFDVDVENSTVKQIQIAANGCSARLQLPDNVGGPAEGASCLRQQCTERTRTFTADQTGSPGENLVIRDKLVDCVFKQIPTRCGG